MTAHRARRITTSTQAIIERVRACPPRRRHVRSDLPLGRDVETGERVSASGPADAGHLLIYGRSGSGKSFAQEALFSTLAAFHRVCPDRAPSIVLIDPAGPLYDRCLRRVVELGIPPERVLLWELDCSDRYLAFQPLACGSATVGYQTSAFLSVIRKLSAAKDWDLMPLLRRWAGLVVAPVIEGRCAPTEFEAMLSLVPSDLRDALLARCSFASIRTVWEEEFSRYTMRQRVDQLSSTMNRLERFYLDPHIKRLVGQTDPRRVIDVRARLDAGVIWLIKMTGGVRLHDDDLRFLVAMALSEIVRAVRQPPDRSRERAVYLLCDEWHRLVGEDLLTCLRETRKFKLFAILSGIDSGAVREYDPQLELASRSCCKTRLLFGGLPASEVEPFVRDAFALRFDAHRVKNEIYRTFTKPRETTRVIHSHSEGRTRVIAESDSEGAVENWSDASASTGSSGISHTMQDGMLVPTVGGGLQTVSTGASGGRVRARGGGRTSSHTVSRAEGQSVSDGFSVVPWYDLREAKELSSRTYSSLPEQLETVTLRVCALPPRYAMLSVQARLPSIVRIYDIPDARVTDDQVNGFRAEVYSQNCYATAAEVDRKIRRRQQRLVASLDANLLPHTQAPRSRRRTGRTAANRAAVNGRTKSSRPTNQGDTSDPLGLMRTQLDTLDLSSEDAIRAFLTILHRLTPAHRRPFLDTLAIRSGKPKSYFTALLKSNGQVQRGS